MHVTDFVVKTSVVFYIKHILVEVACHVYFMQTDDYITILKLEAACLKVILQLCKLMTIFLSALGL